VSLLPTWTSSIYWIYLQMLLDNKLIHLKQGRFVDVFNQYSVTSANGESLLVSTIPLQPFLLSSQLIYSWLNWNGQMKPTNRPSKAAKTMRPSSPPTARK
jgi:hypothetical protein